MVFNQGEIYEQRFIVSESIYNDFIKLFKDKNPLHTSDDFAAAHKFASKVMHGNILNGFISYFVGESLPVKNVIIHSQEIQYQKPVYLNNELLLIATVEDTFESVNAVQFKFVFLNQDNNAVAKGKIQIGII